MDSLRNHAVLLLSCPDKKGIVASVSQFIYEHKGNIVHADQYTDTEKGQFFMRIEWEMNGFDLGRQEMSRAFSSLAQRFQVDWRLYFTDDIPNMAIFVSKASHCLYEILLRHSAGEFVTNIKLIIGNHPDLSPVAKTFGIPFYVFPINSQTKMTVEKRSWLFLKNTI